MYIPVKMLARLDMQMAVVVNAWRKATPPAASESMLGVRRTRFPAQLSESQRWSSVTSRIRFGGRPRGICREEANFGPLVAQPAAAADNAAQLCRNRRRVTDSGEILLFPRGSQHLLALAIMTNIMPLGFDR